MQNDQQGLIVQLRYNSPKWSYLGVVWEHYPQEDTSCWSVPCVLSPLTHAVHKYQLHISLDEDTEYHLQHYFADEYILDHDTYIRFTSLCAYRVPCGRTEPKWTAIKLVLIIQPSSTAFMFFPYISTSYSCTFVCMYAHSKGVLRCIAVCGRQKCRAENWPKEFDLAKHTTVVLVSMTQICGIQNIYLWEHFKARDVCSCV